MKVLPDNDIRELVRDNKADRIRPVRREKPYVVPEDKQAKATNELHAIIKDGNVKADQMAKLAFGMADIFLMAIDKVKPQPIEKTVRIKDWELTVTERNNDREKTIKKVRIKAVA